MQVKTPIAHLKLLCHAGSGNATLSLDDHYEGDVSAQVNPTVAAESITAVLDMRNRIEELRKATW